jgi:outer membrane receptor protein involved in Fe transport
MRRDGGFQKRLLCGTAAAALLLLATNASAEETKFNIAAQPLVDGLNEFAKQSGRPVMFTPDVADAKVTHGVADVSDPEKALNLVLADTGLTWRRSGDTYLIVRASDPQSGSAAGDGADAGTVQALIVTAQKREENIQDVPIAMSAFSQEDLTRSQVAGGPDLMTQVPNFTFTKTNFTGYSIQIRGIGTQAISATTDPAVAVAFNNTPFTRNRFFEQEFYDLERVEVLRGPQGTLYGRNATAGVVNIISAKPSFHYQARLSADVSNYNSSRFEGMINLPLVDNKVALRIAGAWTKRDGYDTNQITGNRIDGRDLWSTRVSLRFAPTDKINANLIWEHFQEDDDRLRSGKQLCHRDVVTHVGDVPVDFYQVVPDYGQLGGGIARVQTLFSQGCNPASLYSPDSFQVPNGLAVPYYSQLLGFRQDAYASATQSRDLRVIESTVDPKYRAKNDTVELQVGVDLSDSLTLTSETAWASDFIFSTQDFNRFNTAPGAWGQYDPNVLFYSQTFKPLPNGNAEFCDPQIGCADRLVAMDLSTAKSHHFSQEFRLASDFDGRFNFSLGANFLRYDTEDKYYVFINSLTISAANSSFNLGTPEPYTSGVTDNRGCLQAGPRLPDFNRIYDIFNCTYIDPNPVENLNDLGHNYFLSKNPYKLISYAVFGEAYYNLTEALKVTAGLRWTVDKKEAPRIPSWVLGPDALGYAVTEVVDQEWREPTGRLAVDWKPDLSFTDQTLLYASYAHGYKAGGANPPTYGIVMYCSTCGNNLAVQDRFSQISSTHPKTFDPEFVNAFEVGAKNTLLDGRMTLNLAGFYYDYTGYQISQIVDRSAVNSNFDATVWGLEVEADWRPLENLRLGFKGGYENTKVADGEHAIDTMDRTAGHPGWTIVRPFPTFPSSCILPTALYLPPGGSIFGTQLWGLGSPNGGGNGGCELAYVLGLDPGTERPYGDWNGTAADASGAMFFWSDPTQYPGFDPNQPDINNGEGFFKDLSGNELPNAPHFTATITADYTLPLPSDWLMTLHTDLYYQSEAWTRIFNTPGYDKLKAYNNVNLAAIFTNEDAGWKIMAYIKNVMDRTNITGAFLNSDDTGLTTNVFLNEPRLYGLRVTKEWTGNGWWTGANPNHPTGEPYPFTIELGGMVQRQDAPYNPVRPSFMDQFSTVLDTTASTENRDLDWGDGREVRLTYRPSASPWSVSAGYRSGRTNGTDKATTFDLAAIACGSAQSACDAQPDLQILNIKAYNYSDLVATNQEQHHIVDFDVGRDFGLGVGLKSDIRAGLRYASFDSTTHLQMWGVPNWDVPSEFAWFKYNYNTHYAADLTTSREFKGLGPALSWDAAKRLLGSDEGHVDLDWSLTGGVLFGKQKTATKGQETAADFSGKYYSSVYATEIQQRGPTRVVGAVPPTRSKSVSAPLLDLSAGLSFETGRVKVGAGYHWERYFNVLDAGYTEHKDVDRTMHGPYFKIAVGFGG